VFLDLAGQQYQAYVTNTTIDELQASYYDEIPTTKFTNMTWKQCESTYNRLFVFGNGDVYFVAPDALNIPRPSINLTEQNGSLIHDLDIVFTEFIDLGQSMNWSDPSTNTTEFAFGTILLSGDFTSDQLNYTACYSELRTEHCQIKFSLGLICIVIISNASKAICMVITFLYAKESTLVTLGDAIASFLDDPDLTTTGLCLASKIDIQSYIWKKPRQPMMWQPTGEKAFLTANTKRWVTVNLSYVKSPMFLLYY
jgi:hypothetical protein